MKGVRAWLILLFRSLPGASTASSESDSEEEDDVKKQLRDLELEIKQTTKLLNSLISKKDNIKRQIEVCRGKNGNNSNVHQKDEKARLASDSTTGERAVEEVEIPKSKLFEFWAKFQTA